MHIRMFMHGVHAGVLDDPVCRLVVVQARLAMRCQQYTLQECCLHSQCHLYLERTSI